MALAFLARENTVAEPGYNRLLVPPAALAVHLSIGQVYAFSTFNLPLTRLLGLSHSIHGDWDRTEIGWTFSIAIVILGLSAALFGRWVERVGPRKSMFAAALCFGAGFIVAAIGIHYHFLVVLYLGYGVLGGCGLGIGYISPVSTLLKWFPDRPGMATGLAIMGFGGGALIAAPLSLLLMDHFKTAYSNGVMETFVTMGVIYFAFMMIGVVTVRVPAAGWLPLRGKGGPAAPKRLVTTENVLVGEAWRTPQFWLLWGILCMNVTAGIGVLSQASPMIQEIFAGRVGAAAAAGFVGLLSLSNMSGRFVWAAVSDTLGRRATYMIFFGLGILLYASVPSIGDGGSILMFVAVAAIIMSMYGGGFATIPAYLRDLFGTLNVGAIHGRLLTAWAVAGILGPMLVNYIREFEIQRGIASADAYSRTLYIMCGLLFVGLMCNVAIRTVDPRRHFDTDRSRADALSEKRAAAGRPAITAAVVSAQVAQTDANVRLAILWGAVGLPLAWGIFNTLKNALALFR